MIAMLITIVVACSKKTNTTPASSTTTKPVSKGKDCWICWQCDINNGYKIIPSTLDTFCDSAKHAYYQSFTYPTVFGCKQN